MIIKPIEKNDLDLAKALVLEVFIECEAPDYKEGAIEAFKKAAVENGEYMASLEVFGAYSSGELLGVIATRNEGRHIALFFVKKEHQRTGIGKALFNKVKKDGMTVNSSLFAKKAYERLGFVATDKKQTADGIHFVPMKYCGEKLFDLFHQLTTAKDTKIGYKALLELEEISKESNVLYPFIKRFTDMAQSEIYAIRVRGFRLFCKQAKWDTELLIDKNFDCALKILNDTKPTAVRQALASLHEVAEYKPILKEKIKAAVESIDVSQYKESMQNLILKDSQELLKR